MSTPVEGKKYDQGKAPVYRALLAYFPRALKAVAEISRYGASKYNVPYEDKNWSRVDDGIGRYRDAASRHEVDEVIQGWSDPESGHPHLAHRVWNDLAALELELQERENDTTEQGG